MSEPAASLPSPVPFRQGHTGNRRLRRPDGLRQRCQRNHGGWREIVDAMRAKAGVPA